MKKFVLLFLMSLCSTLFVFADGVEKTYDVATAGTLDSLLDVDKLTITKLTLTGSLNGTDLRLIREMAGNDYLGQPTYGSLKELDLSGANIVAGGEKYLDTDIITSSTGTYTQNNGENSFHYETEDNVLGKSLFAGCDKLVEVILPNSLTAIGEYQFWYCLRLKSISIGENVSSIGRQLIYGPNKVTNISVADGNATFSSPANTNLVMKGTKVFLGYGNPTFPAGTTAIGTEAFSSCNSLWHVTIPEGVTTIEVGAFAWSSLQSISFPSTLTTIGNDAFAGCSNLTSFTLPETVVHYGDGLGALKDCGNLTSISVEKDNPVYDSRDNCNAIIETYTNTLISGCKNTVIPTSVKIIGYQPFRGVTLSDYVIPNWITKIGEMAFWNANMTSVTIPSSVTYIGEYAFAYPTSLKTVIVESADPVAISENTFTDRADIDLIVPVGSIAAYKSANYWKEFKTIKDVNGNTKDASSSSGKVIDVKTAGTLSTLISNDEKFSITELTITGQLNGSDFRLLREMAGNDYQGNLTNGKLSKLDLSGATIVSGGDYYLNTTTIHWTDNLQMVVNSPMQYGTNNNELGNYLFAGCKSLEAIILPENITTIGFDVFSHNSNLLSLEIPKNVSSISIGVIQECESLSSLSVEDGNQTYSSPDGCNAIIHTANMELVAGCKSTIIPSGIKTIDAYAFQHCISLTSIKIPESITTIGDYAFWGCYGLTGLNIPASVTRIGYMAFYGCSALNSIIVDSENSVYDSRNNCNALIETSSNTLLLGCKNTIIPDGILKIEENAFRPCDGLTSIEIPGSVISIGDNAFAYCYKLESVVSNIKDPKTVTMGSTVFDWISDKAILRVPQGTKDSYLAADGWNGFKEIIEMDSSDRTVNVKTAGTLSTLISNDEKFSITELTIIGQLNGDDFALLRDMAGNDMKGKPTEGKLSKLDISRATIVAGGAYMDLDESYIDLGNDNKLYGFIEGSKKSVANTLGDYLFAGCQKLQSVKTPVDLLTIGERVFAGSGLTRIDLNSGLEAINYCAFWFSKLSSITIPNTVTAIGANGWIENPFAYIDNLTSITLEAGNSRYSMSDGGKLLIDNINNAVVCALGDEAIPEGITTIGSNAFSNRPELVNYVIPEWVTTLTNPKYPYIGNNTFSQCVNLESIVIPEGITVISNSAFVDCKSLNNAAIPSTVTRIGDYAFGNTALSQVAIPANVTYIGAEAFAHNQNLETVISYIENPFDINEDVFAKDWDINNTTYPDTLKVPYGTKALYEAKTGWNKITNIVEMEQTSIITVTANSLSKVFDVYNLSGQKVRSKATSLDDLPQGIYIINGKKVMK